MTLGWHYDRMSRMERGEKVSVWPTVIIAVFVVGGPGFAIATALFFILAALP